MWCGVGMVYGVVWCGVIWCRYGMWCGVLGESWEEGSVIVSNHPRAGGSHLPDITVITPVFESLSQSIGTRTHTQRQSQRCVPRNRPVFFVASRGKHNVCCALFRRVVTGMTWVTRVTGGDTGDRCAVHCSSFVVCTVLCCQCVLWSVRFLTPLSPLSSLSHV